MLRIAGVKFRKPGKVYYFDAYDLDVTIGCGVIVETIKGVELGQVTMIEERTDCPEVATPLKKIIRVATEKDHACVEENIKKAKDAAVICAEKIEKHKLNMRLVDTEYTFDSNKILFYFIADGRVDFRELVKELAFIFKTRIELRQIGIRDQAKIIGGLGVCGREICCKCCLTEFEPVSINMAKKQCLSLNPSKISGSCGRLMCCLRYEQETYKQLLSKVPRVGAIVSTEDGQGVVVSMYLLHEKVKVKLDSGGADPKVYNVSDITIIKNAEEDCLDDTELEPFLE